ncbi:hypothetical protein G7085_19300 [Tessaracoccus sp. HDW20]|uniref:hypothetical protein n=1 Tax=Tessaracoccus coleopterorum TaxID=2714950 RepID=UPI0018D29B44|nr:hypothetical protein [Tessaracoccus coleopterorum]NHB85964.1 hypothetical protein [Tessaracoccus coleopterorum]
MTEYPVPAVWILGALYKAFGGFYEWTVPFMVAFVVLDAAVAISFYRRRNPRRHSSGSCSPASRAPCCGRVST